MAEQAGVSKSLAAQHMQGGGHGLGHAADVHRMACSNIGGSGMAVTEPSHPSAQSPPLPTSSAPATGTAAPGCGPCTCRGRTTHAHPAPAEARQGCVHLQQALPQSSTAYPPSGAAAACKACAFACAAYARKASPRQCPCSHARLLTCAKAVSTVCTTFDEVQVMVGTCWCASALVFRLVLMYTTCMEQSRQGLVSGSAQQLVNGSALQLVNGSALQPP